MLTVAQVLLYYKYQYFYQWRVSSLSLGVQDYNASNKIQIIEVDIFHGLISINLINLNQINITKQLGIVFDWNNLSLSDSPIIFTVFKIDNSSE